MKYRIKKDTPWNRAISKAKKRRIQYTFGSLITVITLLGFFVNSPVFQLHPFAMKDFSLSNSSTTYRTGKPVSFKWALMGTPEKLIIVFGDGNFQEVSSKCFDENGMTYGRVSHIYGLQGKYTPILKAYYPSKTFKKSLEVVIRNEAPLFSFGFNGKVPNKKGGLHTSASPFQAFEDEEIEINVNVTNFAYNDSLTFQFNFGDKQVVTKENFTNYAWKNQGQYPVTITVIGDQGELSKETQYVDVLNRRPNASFSIINGYEYAVGKEIEFTAEDSLDTLSDINNLRYIWDWGDNTMGYGKTVSQTYFESGSFNVTLFVKDDDSLVDQTSQLIEIINLKPEVSLKGGSETNPLVLNEGEAVIFTADAVDDDQDIFKLLYYWNFDSTEFDPLTLEGYQFGGWKNEHVFVDDYEGIVSVAVVDSSNEFNSDPTGVQVLNVAPEVGIASANFIANVSFQLYRNDIDADANFTFRVFKDNKSVAGKDLSFLNSNETEVWSDVSLAHFSLANRWRISLNSSHSLPTDSMFQASIKLSFSDGQELLLTSGQLLGGSLGEWEVDLSSEFFDDHNFSYKYPITVTTQVFDPSKDEVHYSVTYRESKSLEINCSDLLPICDSFTVQGVEYGVEVYEQDSRQIANITAQKVVYSELFDNYSFPLREDVPIELSPLIDIYYVLQGELGLSDLSVIDCLLAENTLLSHALDDDLGESSLSFSFESMDWLELSQEFVPIASYTPTSTNPTPFGRIGGFSNTAYEGEIVKFTSNANDRDVAGMVFMWDFGDGTVDYSKHSSHAWLNAGVYNITLTMADPFGNIYRDQKNITILSQAPEIVGPYAFQGSEGSSVVLDVEIHDSPKDEVKLEYFWYDQEGVLVSQEEKPVFTLDDGTHTFTLKVVDPSGLSSSKEIVVNMHSLSPEIYMSNYMYHGLAGEYQFDNDGSLELTAYGIDTLLDNEKLHFYWTIRNGKKVYRTEDYGHQLRSNVIFTCKQTTTYQGEVRVVDPEGNSKVTTFQIVSTIDSSLDGVDDETEEMLHVSDDPTDTDGDGLTDIYEMTVSNTSYLDYDTDGDRLWDGQTVNGSVGEQSISTNPLIWDSDNDFLSDGTEYFGYNITVTYFENTTNFHVTSDSLDNDTDNDGLSDYAEYYAGSNPRQADTDNDDLTDDIDPFPANWDGDNDALSDFEEIARGTDYNNSDTDQDGLEDGSEVYGWGIGFFTNPLDSDSDHDHVSDSAEIRNYLVKLQKEGFDDLDAKSNITAPMSLHFPHHFEQAIAAQISFGISFGEYGTNATSSYGIEDQDVVDLNIILVKKNDGVILANFTTNSTRYFSQVVDVTEIMNNVTLGLDYFGEYEIGIGYRTDGNYQGTYFGPGFEFPEDNWTNASSTGCNVFERSSPLDGHTDVLVFEDEGSGSAYAYYDDDTARGHGTAQFFFRVTGHLSTDGATKVFYSRRDSYPYAAITLYLDDGKWKTKDGSTYKVVPNIPDPQLDTWYDIKIDWCRDGTNWEGLSNKKFQITINGTSSGPLTYFNSNNYDPTWFRMFTMSTHTEDYSVYYDAFSFSWDEGYDEDSCLKLCPYDYNSTLDTEDVGCYLDYFELDFCRYLDPNDPDTDDDGILDGVEMGALVNGTDVLNSEYYYYYNNLTQNAIGNFSATYSFEEETDGTTNANIGFIDSVSVDSSCGATIVAEYEYHNKIIELSDENSGGKVYAYHTNFDKQNGTIEFWWAQTANNQDSIVKLYDDGTGTALTLYMRDTGSFAWYDGTQHDVREYEDNTWYHHKIKFNCSDGSKGKFSWYIDNMLEANNIDFDDNCQSLDKLLLGTDSSSSGYDVYFDAIGFTWNWTYWEGQNYEEQLPSGASFGHYTGTYSFEDEIGSSGTNIDMIDASNYESAEVISSHDGHTAVLELEADGSGWRNFDDTISDQTNGTIEYWVQVDTVGYCVHRLILYHGSTQVGVLYFHDDGKVYYTDGTAHYLRNYAKDTWYHVRIDFECGSGSYQGLASDDLHIYIDGVHYGDFNFKNNVDHVDKLYFGMGTGGVSTIRYIDAVGYSWDEDYEVGDNLAYQKLELSMPDEFYLEIPHIGVVTNGQLDIEVESSSTTEGSGKVFVELIKEETNLTKSDLLLLEHCEEFNFSQQFSYQASIDLSPYVTTGEIYGAYHLRVQAFSTASNDLFNLTKFEIETDTYIAAKFGDTEAWITDPAENDTDGDGWLDYYEIFTAGTNPCSVDTDGDDTWDDDDSDPLKDVMLEFILDYGYYGGTDEPLKSHDALLQIIINCTFVSPDYSIITPCVLATEGYSSGYYRESDFSELVYYANIEDDLSEYDDEVLIPLQMWLIRRHIGHNDLQLIGENYDPSYYEHFWFDLSDSGTQVIYQDGVTMNHKVYINCTLVGIEKANTIAIFDINSTFTGRYYDREQGYSIIQLQIPDAGHYLGSESFLEDPIGANSTSIAFIDEDNSDRESMVSVAEEIDGHTNVLSLGEGVDDHSDFIHNFASSQTLGKIEWWWRTTDIDNGILYFELENNDGNDAVRLYMRDGKIRYHNGSFHDVMNADSNTWYRMRLDFTCKIGVEGVYKFDLYVNGTKKVSDGDFYSDRDSVTRLRLHTGASPFVGYFDAFGFSWDSNYDLGDNAQTYSVIGTPFEHGMNVIVIPTELFSHTLLHGYLETDTLDETPIYHSDEELFQVSAIERDGQPTQANNDADFMLFRRSISPADAQDVLDLVLKGLLNETWTEENATYIHSYISTKLNDTDAIDMNLPYSVLGYIPWFNPNSNSKMGSDPGGGENVFLWLECLFNPILAENLHSQMAMTGGDFYKYLKGYVSSIWMAIITFLGDLIYLIIRAALIVFSYILLAIELLVNIAIFGVLGVSLYATSLLLDDLTCYFDINCIVPYGVDTRVGYINLTLGNQNTEVEGWILWEYFEFFDVYFPFPSVDVDSSIGEDLMDLVDDSEIEETPPNLHCGFRVLDTYDYQFSTIYSDVNNEGPDYVRLFLISPSGISHSFNMSIAQDYSKSINWWENESIEDWYINEEYGSGYFDYDTQTEEFDPPTWKFGVNFTVDIDFSDSQEFNQNDIEGQWFYYYETKDSTTSELTNWPRDYYGCHMQPGPRIDEGVISFLSHSYVNASKIWETADIEFGVTGYRDSGDSSPTTINLVVVSPNLSVNEFSMTLDSTESYQNEVEGSFFYNKVRQDYVVTIDLDQDFQFQGDAFLYYYFDAEYSGGNHSVLWSSTGDEYDEEADCYNSLFGPVEVLVLTENGNVEIKDFYLEIDGKGVSLKDANFLRVASENVLRFWVGIASDSSHSEIFDTTEEYVTPVLKLSDTPIDPEDIREIELGMVIDASKDIDDDGMEWYYVDVIYGMYSYIWEGDVGQDGDEECNVWNINFGPGYWDIEFKVTDPRTSNNHSVSSDKKIWHSGSEQSLFSAMWGGPAVAMVDNQALNDIGIWVKFGVSVGFGVAAVLAQFKYTEAAARGLTLALIAVDIVFQFIGLAVFITKGDAGALLGTAINGFFAVVGFMGSLVMSSLGSKVANFFKFLNAFKTIDKIKNVVGKTIIVLQLFNMLLATICNPVLLLTLIPMLMSTIGTFASKKHNKLFGILSVVIAVASTILSFFDIPDPDYGEVETVIKAPIPVISFLISNVALGAILGIIGFVSNGGGSGKNFVSSYMKIYLGVTLMSSLISLIGFAVQTQLFSALSNTFPYVLGGNINE